MPNEIIFVIQPSPEGGYEAQALSHSIYTEADTLEELRIMIKDAVACHFTPRRNRVGTLNHIFSDVAAHLKLSKQALFKKLLE